MSKLTDIDYILIFNIMTVMTDQFGFAAFEININKNY